MFCLRNWIALLVFLTNASPLYVFLFLTATYALQRPCVYCSILLIVLVFSLFDFHANWFEPRWKPASLITETTRVILSGNGTFMEALGEAASTALSAVNGTEDSLASKVIEDVVRTAGGGGQANISAGVGGFEWLKHLMEKRQLRIPCVDVIVRL